MRAYVLIRLIVSLLILAGLVGTTSYGHAKDETVEEKVKTIVKEYLDKYKESETNGLNYLKEKKDDLKLYYDMALSQFGQQLKVKDHRSAATTALAELLNPKNKELYIAQPEIKHSTALFYLHAGGVMLNPYTIEKDEDGNFMLKESGETDAHFFIEAKYRNRYAWQDKQLRNKGMDYEMRIGVASTNNDPSGSVVSGAGDAYMEFSIGKLIPCLNNIPSAKSEGVKWVCNVEALIGFVTDKGAQDLHLYWGIGPVVSVGIPYKNTKTKEINRTIEVLGGIYFGQTDKPQLVNGDTREVKSKNELPEFALERTLIWRGDIHFPTGKNGFLTIGGRFISNLEDEGINPWNISIGYTIPVEVITDSMSKLFNQ